MAYEWIVSGLDETWGRLDALVRPRPPEDYDTATALPGWSVRDVLSHLLGFESMLRGTPVPNHEGPWPEYVHNPIGEVNEAFVEANRDRPGLDVLNDFREVATASLTALRGLDDEAWEKVGWSPEGERPYHRFQETRLLDSWIHLEDVRDAFGADPGEGEVGEEVVLNRFESALPYVVGKKVGAPDATSVRLNLTGSRGRTVAVAVRDRRAEAVTVIDGAPSLEVTTTTGLFWRRAAGRVDADAFLAGSNVEGDPGLARSLAEALRIMI
jgi:uncharacterized protein (TIGR03083 family)